MKASESHPVARLAALSGRFDRQSTAQKKAVLRELESTRALSKKQLLTLQAALSFLRAYPDDRALLGLVESLIPRMRSWVEAYTDQDEKDSRLLNSGLPGSSNTYAYSYGVLQHLVQLNPGVLEFQWEDIEDETAVMDALAFTVSGAEVQGLDDIRVGAEEWLESAGAGEARSCLEVALDLFENAPMDPRQQAHLFESCELPVVYPLRRPGVGRLEIVDAPGRVCYQRGPVPRERFPLPDAIRRPFRSVQSASRSRGRELVDLAMRALCSRNLEIYSLIYASPDDVTVVEGGRGVQVVLVGVRPEFRSALESLYFFLILKNGVPVAYGPATVFLGCCEMGINLFPEFRGGEIRYLCTQLMRCLYHVASVRYFFLAAYGMGEHNIEALRTGAFWFYRKLGFSASNPAVEALAREEEAVMKRKPDYRCSMATLRKLSHTTAYLDLSGGECRPLRFSDVGLEATRTIARSGPGNRQRTIARMIRRLERKLPIAGHRKWRTSERNALATWAPILTVFEDLETWTLSDRRALVSIVRAKGARREYDYLNRCMRHPRLAASLRRIAESE